MALAYQESGLDNSKKNPSGAVGIMQILPSTGKDKNVNISNIDKLENNIHALFESINCRGDQPAASTERKNIVKFDYQVFTFCYLFFSLRIFFARKATVSKSLR
ncbi:MAG: transglycosylase SLT domain-containing protein [Desulfobacterales bacterium]|nr:transglycosylase SLT domain-containing protein [Desulfobacterales bacterium]